MNANDSEGLARALFVEAGDALLLFDPQTDQLLDVNPTAERLTGYPRAEMLRLQATYLFRYGGKGGMQRLRQACHETMVFHSQDGFYLRTRQDGVWVPVNITVTRLHVQPRTLALITARDVRERHEAQARLQEAEGELRRVLTSVSDCLWSARLDGAGRWEYRYLSPVVERLTGRPPAYFLAGPERWADVVHPEDRPRWAQALARLRAGEASQDEYRIVRPDGAVRWVRDSVLVSRDGTEGRPHRLDGVLTDVTERRLVEQRFRLILDSAHEAFVGMDAAGVIIDWNQQAEATFGWARAEAVGRLLEETIIPPRHREAHRHGLQRFLVSGEGPLLHKRIEVAALHRNGREFPVELTITPVPLGGTHLFSAFVHDISERKRSEEALARERNLLRALMDHLPDHIFVKDTRSRFVTANAATVHTLGAKSLEEVLGKSDFDFLPQERAQQFHADEQTVLRTGETLFNREELMIDASGQRKWLLTTKAPFRDGAGDIVGLVGMSHDVTERKEAEEERARLLEREQEARAEAEAAVQAREESLQALRASEEQYRSLAEAIPQIVWTADPDGALDYTNRRWTEYTGMNSAQTEESGWAPVVQPEDLQRCGDRWAEALRTAEPYEIEYRLKRASDGAYRWHLDRAVPVRDHAGRVVKWFGACTDIDDQKRAAEAFHKAKEAAEAANRAKSEFLANMSHEIRTPMNGILGMTELALETNLTREQREYLTMVKASADSLLAVINDILDFSRIEARKLHLEAVDFPLRDCLGDMLKALAMRAEEKSLELACHVAADAPDALIGDPTRLRQVIVNLVGNALKFTERGEVVVGVERETTEHTEDAERRQEEASSSASSVCSVVSLHFTVRDTGIGIPADKRRLIFEAFSQADASTTRKYGGTGLGLAICSQLVPMMGGRIWVESEVGQGSTFHFTARFGRAKGLVTRPPAAQPAQLHGLRALVVDDNATNRRILEEVLHNWGLRIVAVDGGAAALAAVGQAAAAGEPFPLVLLDAHMPEMDGFDLAERIRRAPAMAGAAIVMLTSAGHPEDVARCRALGIDAYLMKPVKQSELLEAVLAALGQSLRFAEAPAARRFPLAPAGKEGRPTPLRILLAEDHPVNQKLAVRLLEKQGHTVVVAGDGKEALAALTRQAFDLVLMDVSMPTMDGFEAAGCIRRQEQGTGRHVPILAMTAHAMKGDRERCLEAGMDGYVAKPIQPHELYEAIDALVAPAAARRRPRPWRSLTERRRWPASAATMNCSRNWPECSSTPCRSRCPSCGRPSGAATARPRNVWPTRSRERWELLAPAPLSRRRCAWRRWPVRATWLKPNRPWPLWRTPWPASNQPSIPGPFKRGRINGRLTVQNARPLDEAPRGAAMDIVFLTNLGAALLLGVLIGVERQYNQHPAGLRTNALVCLGAALFVLLPHLYGHDVDPDHIAGQVVTGVGFLCGGVILREGLTVKGMNTAATLWCSAAVGALSGAGYPLYAAVGTLAVVGLHLGLRPVGRWIDAHTRKATDVETIYRIRVVCEQRQEAVVRTIVTRHVGSHPGLVLQGIATQDAGKPDQGIVTMEVFSASRNDRAMEDLTSRIDIEPGVTEVRWERAH